MPLHPLHPLLEPPRTRDKATAVGVKKRRDEELTVVIVVLAALGHCLQHHTLGLPFTHVGFVVT